jgi:hypothetical protein
MVEHFNPCNSSFSTNTKFNWECIVIVRIFSNFYTYTDETIRISESSLDWSSHSTWIPIRILCIRLQERLLIYWWNSHTIIIKSSRTRWCMCLLSPRWPYRHMIVSLRRIHPTSTRKLAGTSLMSSPFWWNIRRTFRRMDLVNVVMVEAIPWLCAIWRRVGSLGTSRKVLV